MIGRLETMLDDAPSPPPGTTRAFTILSLSATGRRAASVSRSLAGRIVGGLVARHPGAMIIDHDLVADPVPVVDDAWIDAAFAKERRTRDQVRALAVSDRLVEEFARADALVIAAPIYNFSIPAALKLWIDQVARIGRTFRHTQDGPVPLTPGRPAYVVVTSGGTPIGSDIDFATGYLRHVLGFLGITEVHLIGADRLTVERRDTLRAAEARIDALLDGRTPAPATPA